MHDTTQSGLTRSAVSTGQSDELTRTRAPQALTRSSGTPQRRNTTDHPASEHQRPQPRVQRLWRSTTSPPSETAASAPQEGDRAQRINTQARRTGEPPKTGRSPRSPYPRREGHAVAQQSRPTASKTDEKVAPGEVGKHRPPTAEEDEGAAPRPSGNTPAHWSSLDPAAPPQRTKTLATAPPRPSAAPAEARRRCRRRRRPQGAARPHAEGVAAPDFPLRQGGSAPRGACAAVVAARIGRREDPPQSASPRPPTTTGADEDALRAPARRVSCIA